MNNSVETLDQLNITPEVRFFPYRLLWRQGQLLVSGHQSRPPSHLSTLHHEQRLVDCLKNSPVRLVRLDANLGEAALTRWAKACTEAKKSVYLWSPFRLRSLKSNSVFSHPLIQFLERLFVLSLTVFLTPLMAGLALLVLLESPGPLFQRPWYVGQRGKLFQAFQFRTFDAADPYRTTTCGYWLDRTNLYKLPQLLNVIRGEISLMDAYHLSLDEVLQRNP